MKFYQLRTAMFYSAALLFLIASVVFIIIPPAKPWALFAITFFIVIILAVFYKLEITLTERALFFSFGIGLIQKHIELSEVFKAEAVKNPWWLGWGIRLGTDYTLYSVSGLHAVVIFLKGNKKKLIIGTNAPEELAASINQNLVIR
ncbi:hypothetical protein [Dyadobacter sp. CY356]|uniref:hypothetical protein n=1 Tax=Dyadobacter sp. CY356 TaxID=2906442 RepID=UPI001F4371FF|nr:hypothetical protein [Dyadobacter sp. CY356]MCF0055076.1 hypothetical protein [Dyadobacter sp. CY356]